MAIRVPHEKPRSVRDQQDVAGNPAIVTGHGRIVGLSVQEAIATARGASEVADGPMTRWVAANPRESDAACPLADAQVLDTHNYRIGGPPVEARPRIFDSSPAPTNPSRPSGGDLNSHDCRCQYGYSSLRTRTPHPREG